MKIRQLRKMLGYTQAAFAAKYGIAQNTLSNYETGKRTPDPKWLARVAITEKVPADYLLDADQICDGRMGQALKEEREEQGYSLKDVAKKTKIPLQDLKDYEEDSEPINKYLFLLLCDFYGTNARDFYIDHEMIDEDIPSWFDGDMREYLDFLEARDADAKAEQESPIQEEPETPLSSPEDKQLLADFHKLNAFGQEKALDYIRDLTEQTKYTEGV